VEGQKFVQAIVTNVTCEVQNAVHQVYTDYEHTFLDNWGVQITLSLTIEEKSAVNPTVNWLPPSPPSAIFNLGAGGTLSAGATRIDKLNSYYLVSELRYRACDPRNRPGGAFLMQSDLKLKEWLYDVISTSVTGTVPYERNTPTGPFKQNVVSHQVKFEVLSSGNVTPGWKLTRVSINPTGTFFATSRNRTHDLLVTFGPAEKALVETIVGGRKRMVVTAGPSTQAAFSHLSSEIGVAVSNGLKSALLP